MLKPFFRTLLVASLSLLAVTTAFGQATDGNIVGTVSDASGAAVPNATVVAENTATGVKTTTKTGSDGTYRAPNLLVGTYNVTASASGMAATTIAGVPVALNANATINIALKVGSVATTIEIADSAPPIDTTTAQVANTYSVEVSSNLPSTANPAGGILNLSLLGSGVSSNGGVGVGTGPSVGGQRPRNNSFNIEGVDNNRKDVTGPATSVPAEAVAEFTLLQNQFSAEYGHSSGGQFNSVLVNGTNAIHGAGWEYLQNRNLNAVDQAYKRQFGNAPAPRYDQNRMGGMIGGPIKKNKLFYFGSYDYNPLGQAGFAGSATYAPTAAGYSALASIPGVNQTLLKTMQQYVTSAPTQASGAAGVTQVGGVNIPIGILPIAGPNFQNIYRWIVSVDYNLSERDQLRARYIDNKTSTIDTAANLPTFWLPQPVTAHLGTFSEFHNFTPNLINEFRAAYNRYVSLVPTDDSLKFPGLDTFPNICINNDLNLCLGPDGNAPQNTYQSTYQLVDNVTWIKGKHEFKFGFDGRDQMALSTFVQRQRGDYQYSTLDLFLRDQLPDQLAQRNIGVRYYSGNLNAYYMFANDNWKVRRDLTFNLGLRYEYNGVAQSMKLFDANAIANTPGVLTFKAPVPQKTNFAPRIGFAYTPGNNSDTSIRGGFGIAYDQVFDNVGTNATPPEASATVNATPPQYPTTGFLAAGAINGNAPATFTAAVAKSLSSSYLPPVQKQGYAITWNLSVQHVFAKNYTAEIRYIGNRGVHLLFQNQINRNSLVTPTVNLPIFYSAPTAGQIAGLTNGLCPAGKPTAAANCMTVGGNQSTLNNPLLPYGYTSSITEYAPLGNSSYHGLATQLTRRFSDGLLFQAAYTYSHLIDDSTSEVNSTALTPRRPQDFGNLTSEKASSALDHRHRLTYSTVYDVPWFAKDSNWVKRNLLGNMRAGGIYTYETGEWATPQSATDVNLNGDSAGDRVVINLNGTPGTSSAVTAVLNANGATVGYTANNPSAYYIKGAAGVLATSGRNIVRTPPINNIDLNLAKLFSYKERAKLEIRADFFNFLNHAQYTTGSPNTTNLKSHAGETNYLTPGNPLFLRWDQAFGSHPRTIQIGAKITF